MRARWVPLAVGALSCTALLACRRGRETASQTTLAPEPPKTATVASTVVAAAMPPPRSPFSIVWQFAPRVETRLYPLGAHVAVWQRRNDEPYGWNLVSIGSDGRRADLTTSIHKRILDDHMDILYVGGPGPDDVWIGTSYVAEGGAMAFVMNTWNMKGGSLKLTNQPGYRFVGELRKGQWVGIPFAVHPGYVLDDPPRAFRNVSGSGPLPTLPPNLSLFKATFLGDGRACGLGARVGVKNAAVGMELWTAGPEGTHSFALGELVQEAEVVAAARECVVVTPDKDGTTFRRVRGDALSTVRIARSPNAISAAHDGTIWMADGTEVVRVQLAEASAEVKTIPLPAVPGCPERIRVSSIVAFEEGDVWLTASCEATANAWSGLLHTQAPPPNVAAWPAP